MNVGDKVRIPASVSHPDYTYEVMEINEIPEDEYGNRYIVNYLKEGTNRKSLRYLRELDDEIIR